MYNLCITITKNENKIMKKLFKKRWKMLAGAAGGALLGYIYYVTIGCESGSCPITSSPLYSSLWGALIGLVLFSSPCCGGSCSNKNQ